MQGLSQQASSHLRQVQFNSRQVESQVIYEKSRFKSFEKNQCQVKSHLSQVQLESQVICDKSKSNPKSFDTSPSQVPGL